MNYACIIMFSPALFSFSFFVVEMVVRLHHFQWICRYNYNTYALILSTNAKRIFISNNKENFDKIHNCVSVCVHWINDEMWFRKPPGNQNSIPIFKHKNAHSHCSKTINVYVCTASLNIYWYLKYWIHNQ